MASKAYKSLAYEWFTGIIFKLILAGILVINIIPLGVKISMLTEDTHQE